MICRKILSALLLLPFSVYARSVLVLDAGHTPQNGGAMGVSGQYEVVYNDRFVAELKPALEQAGWQVVLTRQPHEERSLAERAQIANQLNADVFLSIHHDSAQLQDLQKTEVNGQTVYQTTQPIQGYSVFVSGKNPQFSTSKQMAIALGKQLRQTGRPFNAYHNRPISGENRPFLDQTNGVYQYDGLAVLRLTKMPAALVEVGVIVDKADEQVVSQAEQRQNMIRAIVSALQTFRRNNP